MVFMILYVYFCLVVIGIFIDLVVYEIMFFV